MLSPAFAFAASVYSARNARLKSLPYRSTKGFETRALVRGELKAGGGKGIVNE